jgi:hypothetical protein
MEKDPTSTAPENTPLRHPMSNSWLLQIAGYTAALTVGVVTTVNNIRDRFYDIASEWPGLKDYKTERTEALDALITDAQNSTKPVDNKLLYEAREKIFDNYHAKYNAGLKKLGFEAEGLTSPKGILQRWRVIGQGTRHTIIFTSIVSTVAAAGTITVAGLVHRMFKKLNAIHGTIDDSKAMLSVQEDAVPTPPVPAQGFRQREDLRNAEAAAQPMGSPQR